jgi:2'-5' RNA ligase
MREKGDTTEVAAAMGTHGVRGGEGHGRSLSAGLLAALSVTSDPKRGACFDVLPDRRALGRYLGSVSRGIVLWPDEGAEATITRIWVDLAERHIPTLATEGHRRHRPHLSLVVAAELPSDAALRAVGRVPEHRLPFSAESVGIFPNGTLFLACVMSQGLLDEQRRVHRAVETLTVDPWPYYEPGRWTPHVTIGNGLTPPDMAVSLALLTPRLPITGTFDTGGVEDSSSGDRWVATDTDVSDVTPGDPHA